MNPLTDRLNAIKAALAAMYPARVVTRDALDPASRKREDLVAGTYTLISLAEDEFTNVSGYEAQDGAHGLLIVGDLELNDPNVGESGIAVEDAELDMVEEIKGFVRNLPANICKIDLVSWQQSGQMSRPRGWVMFNLVYQP